jgi:hypothetical protein
MGNFGMQTRLPAFDTSERLSFICPDPFWDKDTSDNFSLSIQSSDVCLGDLCFPFCLGSNVLDDSTTVSYTGDWQSDVIDITIVGPAVSPQIQNVTTGKTITIDRVIGSGEIITVQIRPNFVTISSNLNGNILGSVTNVSDLNDFVLITKGKDSPNGDNVIRFASTGGTPGETTFSMTYNSRFLTVFGGE